MHRLCALVVTTLLVAACAGPSPAPSSVRPSQSPGPSSVPGASGAPPSSSSFVPRPSSDVPLAEWQTDIGSLVGHMADRHPQLDHGVHFSVLNAAATDLINRSPGLTDNELLDGVMHIVALVSSEGCDAHTGAYVWGTDDYPVNSLPLKLWLFDDDVYIVDALAPYTGLVGRRITSIAATPIADAMAKLDPLIPRDNDETVKLLLPRYLLIPEFLDGVGIHTGSSVALELLDERGTTTDVTVDAISITDYNEWAGQYGLLLPQDPDVLYLSRQADTLWWQKLDDGTLFVQYNEFQRVPAASLDELRAAASDPSVTRIAYDLRLNTGGEVSAIDPMVQLLSEPEFNQPHRLFVITGRNTFSASGLLLARVVDQTQAIVVGEPMSGCPTTWGNPTTFDLDNTKIGVTVATMLEVGVSDTDPRQTIEPDVPVTLTEADWANGVDPALDAITAAE